MKYLYVVFLAIPFLSFSQDLYKHEVTLTNYVEESTHYDIQEAEKEVRMILDALGLVADYRLVSSTRILKIAYPTVNSGVRTIKFNPISMQEIRDSTGTHWSTVFVMAHEIAHLLNYDLVNYDRTKERMKESNADIFAGMMLARLGATKEEALSFMKYMNNKSRNDLKQMKLTHPTIKKTRENIINGYNSYKK